MKKPTKQPVKKVVKKVVKKPSIEAIPYKPTPEDVKRKKEWQARSDIDTLKQANEIMADKARLEAAKSHAKKTIDSLNSIASKK